MGALQFLPEYEASAASGKIEGRLAKEEAAAAAEAAANAPAPEAAAEEAPAAEAAEEDKTEA